MRTTLVDRDLLRELLAPNRLTSEGLGSLLVALGGQQKVNRVARFVAA